MEEKMSDLHLRIFLQPRSTYVTRVNGSLLLLNTQTGETIGLNVMAGFIWQLFSEGASFLHVIHHLEEHYAIDTQTLHYDVLTFLQELLQKRLLVPQSSYPVEIVSSTNLTLPLILRLLSSLNRLFPVALLEWIEAFFLLRYSEQQLSFSGLEALTNLLIALPTLHHVTPQDHVVHHFARLVRSASRWQPFQAACLHQCVALCFLLRLRQKDADLVIGVTTFPFFAHAWVTSRSQPIYWAAGLGLDSSIERIQHLSILFCTSQEMR